MILNYEEVLDYTECYAGYCTDCNQITQDYGVEPDAEKYSCLECGEHTVMGIENAILMGHISIE